MLARVKKWLADDVEVRIITARVSGDSIETILEQKTIIRAWLYENNLGKLYIDCKKDYGMLELWDDRAVQVIPNTGERVDGSDAI